jgi:tRNA (uracil-5-)-methyltransferase TRM9
MADSRSILKRFTRWSCWCRCWLWQWKILGCQSKSVHLGLGSVSSSHWKLYTRILSTISSTNLIKIAKKHNPHSAIVADNLSLPHPPHSLDFAISIAVIHHLSTPARRIEAVKAILDLLNHPARDGKERWPAKALIYVWALEQKDSRRGWDEGHEQDVMVPWVMKGKKEKVLRKGRDQGSEEQTEGVVAKKPVEDKTFLRYYHLYRKGELESDIVEAGGEVLESGYEKDNWWAIATLRT